MAKTVTWDSRRKGQHLATLNGHDIRIVSASCLSEEEWDDISLPRSYYAIFINGGFLRSVSNLNNAKTIAIRNVFHLPPRSVLERRPKRGDVVRGEDQVIVDQRTDDEVEQDRIRERSLNAMFGSRKPTDHADEAVLIDPVVVEETKDEEKVMEKQAEKQSGLVTFTFCAEYDTNDVQAVVDRLRAFVAAERSDPTSGDVSGELTRVIRVVEDL